MRGSAAAVGGVVTAVEAVVAVAVAAAVWAIGSRVARRLRVRPQARTGRQGTVYFIGDGEGRVKIGYTAGSAAERMKDLQTGSPQRLRLLATQPGSMRDERALHRRFAHARIRQDGEWFRATPGLRRHIAGRKPIPWRAIVLAVAVAAVVALV